ncbi:hypothetical protein SO694_00066179 [Aureococcus anophagefferens]|uniref:Uncharacterized protein n=1 Tax=Aureococcus anophagefferens TaxID=44056 RepID=A0ABR1FQ94_AURAN
MKSFLPMPDPIEREIDESPNDITSFPDRRIHWNPDDDADDDVGLPLSPPNPPSMLPRGERQRTDSPAIPKLAPLTRAVRQKVAAPAPARLRVDVAGPAHARRGPQALEHLRVPRQRGTTSRSERRSLRGNWSVEDDAWEDDAAEEATCPCSKPDMDESAPAPPPLLRKDDAATDRSRCSRRAAADYAVGLAGGHSPWVARCFGFAYALLS